MMGEEAPPPPSQPTGTYKTTRPILPPFASREVIRTESISSKGHIKIEIRPLQEADLEDLHRLRTQYEVMKWTSTGRCDKDIEFTKTWVERFVPPNDIKSFNNCIFVSEDGGPFEHIGIIGCHIISPVSNIGYMLRKEWWGKGVATAAVQAFLEAWWKLERKEVDLEFSSDKATELEVGPVRGDHIEDAVDGVARDPTVVENAAKKSLIPEIVFAEIESSNGGSRKVLTRCGFKFRGHEDIDEDGKIVGLDYYTLTRPQA